MNSTALGKPAIRHTHHAAEFKEAWFLFLKKNLETEFSFSRGKSVATNKSQ